MKISERLMELAATHGWDDIALKSIVEAIEQVEQTHDEANIDQIPGYKALQRIKHISTTFGTIATLPEIARLSTDAVAEIESRYVQRNKPSRSEGVYRETDAEGKMDNLNKPTERHSVDCVQEKTVVQPSSALRFDFADALKRADNVFHKYREDQPKWWRRMDGTPILNDVAVRMAQEIISAYMLGVSHGADQRRAQDKSGC